VTIEVVARRYDEALDHVCGAAFKELGDVIKTEGQFFGSSL
jgi:hypothetical protein